MVYKLHDTVSVKQPAPKPCCLSLGAIPWMPAMAHHTFITRCSRTKEIALDTHYDGGAINQSIPSYLQDVGRFRDFRSNWTLSRAADARSTSSDISSALYLQLYSSFLVLLEAEDPPLRSESTRTKWTCFRIRNNTATYHKLKRLHSSAQTWYLRRRDWPGNFKVLYVTLTSKYLMPKTNSCAYLQRHSSMASCLPPHRRQAPNWRWWWPPHALMFSIQWWIRLWTHHPPAAHPCLREILPNTTYLDDQSML